MAWVRPKHKPKQKNPAQEVESLRPLLQFFSAGHTPRQSPSRPRQLAIMPPPPQPQQDNYYEVVPPAHHHHHREFTDEFPEEPIINNHAFSFSRDKLVPIAPKQQPRSSRPKSSKAPPRVVAAQPPQQQIIERPVIQYIREPSPPPPSSRPRTRPPASHYRSPPPRRRGAADAAARSVSSRWASATTPLEL